MKKLWSMICVCLLGISLAACAGTKQKEEVRILAPSGAPALGILGAFGEEAVASIDTVSGSDVLQAELAKENGTYDIIVAPSNLGMNLSAKGADAYELAAVITWGNLYLVAQDADALEKEGQLAAFGEKAVPQLVLQKALDLDAVVPEITYYNAVSDAQAQLLSGKADVALLAEPVVTATIAKAKEQGKELQVIADLQQLYAKQGGEDSELGYPQAAIFVKKGEAASLRDLLEAIETFANETSSDESKLRARIEQTGADTLGVPNADVAIRSWKRQNIRYVKATEAKEELKQFADVFGIDVDIDALLVEE